MYIGLPTGGAISYSYTTIPQCMPYNTFTSVNRAVSTRTVDVNDGSGPHIWSYSWGTYAADGSMTNTVTDPNGNDTVHVVATMANTCSFYETRTQYFQGTGSNRQLMKTVDTQYSQPTGPSGNGPGAFASNVVPTVITNTLSNGKVSQIQRDYASDPHSFIYGNVTEERDYDYGQGSPGPLLRKTLTSLLWQNNSNYLNLGMLDLPFSTVVRDGSGNRVAETDYSYDNYSATSGSPIATGVSSQLLDTNPPTALSLCTVTSISHSINPPSAAKVTISSTDYDTRMLANST